MGKGDKKTKRGKISMGTFGVRRPRKKSKPIIAVTKKKAPKKTSKAKPAAKKTTKAVAKK